MARVVSAGWVSGQTVPDRLRLYHFLFIVLTTLLAVAVAAPTVLGQQTLFQSRAQVQIDPSALPGLIEGGKPTAALRSRQSKLGGVLKLNFEGLGGRLRGLQWSSSPQGQIVVTSYAPNAMEAQRLADLAAENMARWSYTVLGDHLLDEVLSHRTSAALNGLPASEEAAPLLGDILLTGAAGDVRPRREARSLEQLNSGERFALTRSLEVLYDLKGLDHRVASAALDVATDPQAQQKAREEQRGAQAAQRAVDALLTYMYNTHGTRSALLEPAPAYVQAQAATPLEIQTHKLPKLLIAGFVGFLGGLLTVRIDRNVGILPTLLSLWGYRELIRNIVSRDLKARYKNSLLGYFWSLLNPLMTMLIFWVVFSLLLRNNIPHYPVFLIVALLPYQFAVASVSGGMRSILDNSNLVKKVFFPRAILPITAVLSNLVNYLLALPVMLLVMVGVQLASTGSVQFSWTFLYLPVIIVIQTLFLIGVTLLLSTVAVYFRDTTHIIDIFLQLWIFVTPVFFTLDAVTQGNALAAKAVRWLNPMASLIDFYRDVLYGRGIPGEAIPRPPSLPALDGVFRTLVTALVILAIGAYVFQRNSPGFGEEL